MNRLSIILDSDSPCGCCYQICGQLLIVNKPLGTLLPFRSPSPHGIPETDIPDTIDAASRSVIFRGQSWLAADNREIICSRDSNGFVINIPDAACFYINDSGSGIWQLTGQAVPAPGVSDAELEQLLLGPPLMLALALNRKFALHASSVVINNRAVLFVGDSGSGKSTLAAWLNCEKTIERMTDDISVICDGPSGHRLLGDFPQLKLKENQQLPNAVTADLSAIVALQRNHTSTPRLTRLEAIESMAVLVNHSVASQLFDKPLAQRHLGFMAELCSNTPVYRLDYPGGREYIENIAALLRHEIN